MYFGHIAQILVQNFVLSYKIYFVNFLDLYKK